MNKYKVIDQNPLPWIPAGSPDATPAGVGATISIWCGIIIIAGIIIHLATVTFATSEEKVESNMIELRLWIGNEGFLGIAVKGAIVLMLGFIVIIIAQYGLNISQNFKVATSVLSFQTGKLTNKIDALNVGKLFGS